MAYQKTNWVDNVTKVTATRLNNMEKGIEDAQAIIPENAGSTGYVLTKTADGVEWSAAGAPTGDQVSEIVTQWLDDHPEATTTVADGSITMNKLDSNLQGKFTDLSEIDARVGKLADLDTATKASIVAAINEARNTVANNSVSLAKLTDDVLDVFDSYADGIAIRNGLLYLTHNGIAMGQGIEIATGGGGLSFATGRIDAQGFMHLVDADGFDIDDQFTPFYVGTGGGGGGGGGGNNATLNVSNTSGWISKSVPVGQSVTATFVWSSLEGDLQTGPGTMVVRVNGITKINRTVQQGNVSVNLTPLLSAGTNTVKITISDVYENVKTLSLSVSVITLEITSSFDDTAVYSNPFDFPYTPNGTGAKTIYFLVDGTQIGYATTSSTGRQSSYLIPAQTHGAHTLECYFTTDIDGETVESNHLVFSFMYAVDGNIGVIISSSFDSAITVPQYTTLQIPYVVYNPASLTTQVLLKVNGTMVSSQSVDRAKQTWTYRCDTRGSFTLTIVAGTGEATSNKSFSLVVTQSDIDVEAEESNLALYLSAVGRSNNDSNRTSWSYENVSATMSNFNFTANGWVNDKDGNTVLRVSGDARVTIPYQIFDRNFISTGQSSVAGKTIEVDFATSNVKDYNTVVFSCWSGNRGLQITPQNAVIKSANTELNSLYKDNEHIRLTFVIEPLSENRLIYCYINGIMSRAVQYIADDNFAQATPVGITIGSNDAVLDIYTIRIYDKALTRYEALTNWIADTQNVDDMLDRYSRNQVYDNNVVTTESLPSSLPYMIIECAELPQFKGDKKTCSGSYVNKEDPSKSFTFTGCQINVQGTSSAIYYRKNYDLQFKSGFDMNGENFESYALRDGSIPFNRFVLKADVASSEGANNTELTMFYNDTCPYKTPEMQANSKVRWGIEGIPIGLFWYNTLTQTTQFLGKHNFNLPKRAPAPYGYTGDDQSWEWERNNSANVKFQDTDFTSQTWDQKEQKYYPTWYDDFEARFPSDEWRDYAALNEFLTWVKSTWRDEATNATLSPSVTYTLSTPTTVNQYPNDSSYTVVENTGTGGSKTYTITFTKDTPAYRLTKFRAEFGDYAEIDSAVFYYLFTEMFLMIDSRAKNMFVGFHGSPVTKSNRLMARKAVFEPYDMDTAIGTNNSGVLMFGYYLEDTDTVSSIISGGDSGASNANVFNAQDSVLWVNVRDAFRAEINTMYDTLRTGTKVWDYTKVEKRFEDHQNKWAEAIFNEDAYIKYLTPLIDPVTEDEQTGELIRTDRYLTMLQGSKTEQRKWWLWNRFRYMDSKFNSGDAVTNTINMRLFNSGTLTLTPATDLYLAVRFGGGSTPMMQRTSARTPVSFTYAQAAQEMETWIYSADMIVDVGDLSVFYPNECDFSHATRLERLQIGNATAGYSNSHLNVLNVQNSTMLRYLDVRNCPNLTQAIDLSGSKNIEEVYFDNTAITAIVLPNGGVLNTLHLPSTITTMRIENQPYLTELVMPSYENLSTLVLENAGTAIDSYNIVKNMQANGRIRIIGFEWTVETIEEVIHVLSSAKGIDANGQTVNYAQLSGVINVTNISAAEFYLFSQRYPDVTVRYTSMDTDLFYIFANQPDRAEIPAARGVFPGVTSWQRRGFSLRANSVVWFPHLESVKTQFYQYAQGNVSVGIGKQGDTEIAPASSTLLVLNSGGNVGKFYVPDDLVDEYKEATNWSAVADKIKPLSEAPYSNWNGGYYAE